MIQILRTKKRKTMKIIKKKTQRMKLKTLTPKKIPKRVEMKKMQLEMPLLKKILFWEVLRKINALLGAVVAVISTTLILSLICTTFNTLNLGDINTQKITDFATNCNDKEMVEQELDKVFKRDASMRDYFEPRFVAYETLDSSIFFGALVWLGDNVCPSLGTFNDEMAKNVKQYAANYVTQEMLNNDFAE